MKVIPSWHGALLLKTGGRMQVTRTELDGVLLVKPPVFEDFRGQYVETYNDKLYAEHGIGAKFVQDDISVSIRHVLRGIHGDAETWKLVSCLQVLPRRGELRQAIGAIRKMVVLRAIGRESPAGADSAETRKRPRGAERACDFPLQAKLVLQPQGPVYV
jgi:hypothetical protein